MIKLEFEDNRITLVLDHRVEPGELKLKISRNDDRSLVPAWIENEERYGWVNSGEPLALRALYPKRPLTGKTVISLNRQLVNLIKSLGQTVVVEIRLLAGDTVLGYVRPRISAFVLSEPTAADVEDSKNHIAGLIETEASASSGTETEEVAEPEEEPAPQEPPQTGSAEERIEPELQPEPEPQYACGRQLEIFFRGMSQTPCRKVSDSGVYACFAAGIVLGAILAAAVCTGYSNGALPQSIGFLFPRGGDGSTGEHIAFWWVLATLSIFLVSLLVKTAVFRSEEGGTAATVNRRLFLDLRGSDSFTATADAAVADLAGRGAMSFVSLFAGSLLPYRCGSRTAYGSTGAAADFFNEETVGSRSLHYSRLMIPAVLTAFGVLGTFVGLLLSLEPLRAGELGHEEMLRSNVSDLISGASTAFITSIWGVLLSIVYSLVISGARLLSSRKIRNLQDNINSVFYPYLIPSANSGVEAAVRNLGVLLCDRLDRTSSAMAGKIAAAISEYVADVNDHTLGEVRAAIDMFRDSFLEVLHRQSGELEKAAGRLVAAQDDAAEHIRQKFEQWELQHKDLIDQVQREYSSVTENAEKYIGVMRQTGEYFSKLSASFEQSGRTNGRLLEEASRSQQAMGRLAAEVQQRIDTLSEILAGVARYQDQMVRNASGFSEFVKLQKQYQETLGLLAGGLERSCREIAGFRDTVSFSLQQEYERLAQRIEQTGQQNTELLRHNIGELNRCWIDVVRDNMQKMKTVLGDLEQISGNSRGAGTGKK